jgi:HK97 family phage portal protein
MEMFKFLKKLTSARETSHTYFLTNPQAQWSAKGYQKCADEAYIKNVIAHRSISMIAASCASVPFKLYRSSKNTRIPLNDHPILKLLRKPNPVQSTQEFMETIYAYRQIAGNAYILSACSRAQTPQELYALRPDRITVLPGENFIPHGYLYQVDEKKTEFRVNPLTGASLILHIKNFHPLSDWYGLSSIEAAAYSIDQHNQAGEWNQALLQNGARPSGAIVVKGEQGMPANLSEEQYIKLKGLIDDTFAGPRNAGRPIILEGGLDWREMSLSPKDMDYIESKHSSARDIALALGMPPQLLGIPGDNTYANLQEARLALWEQTIIPMVENVIGNLNTWLQGFYSADLELSYSTDDISALTLRKEAMWNRLDNCKFMTINEKRQTVGLGPIAEGNRL